MIPYLKEFTGKLTPEFISPGNTQAGIMTNKHSPGCSMMFAFHDGVAYEPPDLWGISHFIEHILFRGTEKYPTLYNISRQVEDMGGQISAYSTRDMTAFWIKTLPSCEEKALNIMYQLLTKPALKEEFIEAERHIIQQERLRELNDPGLYSSLMMENLLLMPDPVSRHPVGIDEVINKMNSEILGNYIKKNYHKNNMVIGAAGNFSSSFTKKLEQMLKDFPEGTIPKKADFKVPDVIPGRKTYHLVSHHKSQIYLSMGWKFPIEDKRDIIYWRTIRTLLTSGYTSLLNNLLREKENITYLCTSRFNSYGSHGILKINLALADKNLERALCLIDTLFQDLKYEKFSEELYKASVIRHGSSIIFMMENSMEVAKIIGETLARENSKFSFKDYMEELNCLEFSHMCSLVKKHLTDKNKKIFLQTGSQEVYRIFDDIITLEKTKEGVAVTERSKLCQ